MSFKLATDFASTLIHDDMAEVEWESFQSSVLIEVKRGDEVFTSSAVAISRNALLTCAHSVENIEDGRVFWDAEYRPHSKKFLKFKKIILHPKYDQKKSNYENDLAIIVLRSNLPSRIRPAKINTRAQEARPGMQAHRIGFGARGGANIRTWTNPEIMGYERDTKSFVLKDSNGQIGDSGGPLFIKVGSAYKLFALHSTKEGEDTAYTVSVADHLAWIQENMSLRSLES